MRLIKVVLSQLFLHKELDGQFKFIRQAKYQLLEIRNYNVYVEA